MGTPRGSKIPLERTQEISTRRLELDYVAPVRRPHWPGLVVLAVSLAVAGAMLVRYRDAQREVVRLEAESGLIAPDRRPARAVSRERLEEEAKLAEGVVRQLTLPWAKLIGTIEQAASRDVAILQLQPDAEQRLLRLTAEARDREAMQRLRTRTPHQPVSSGGRADELRRFYNLFPPASELTDDVERLHRLARSSGLDLAQGEYRLERRASGLWAYRVTLPVRGSYAQLRGFLGVLLTSMPTASIDALRFERKKAADTQLEAQVRVTLHARPSGDTL